MTAIVKWSAWVLFAVWSPLTFIAAMALLPLMVSGADR